MFTRRRSLAGDSGRSLRKRLDWRKSRSTVLQRDCVPERQILCRCAGSDRVACVGMSRMPTILVRTAGCAVIGVVALPIPRLLFTTEQMVLWVQVYLIPQPNRLL